MEQATQYDEGFYNKLNRFSTFAPTTIYKAAGKHIYGDRRWIGKRYEHERTISEFEGFIQKGWIEYKECPRWGKGYLLTNQGSNYLEAHRHKIYPHLYDENGKPKKE